MTEFSVLIEQFLSEYDQPRTVLGYRRKIMVFSEFLKHEMLLVENNYETLLRGLDSEVICQSIHAYIADYHIKFRITAQNYFTVVTAFFKFLDKKHGVTNKTFINSSDYEKLKVSADKIIGGLKKREGKEPISDEDFERLRLSCDSIINEANPDTQYMAFCSAIIIKITMLIGLKNNEIDKITLGSHDEIKYKLKINGYTLRLPDLLAQQLIKYRQIRNTIGSTSKEAPLFVTKAGKDLKDKNNEKYCSMEESLKHKKSESVAKRAIINMLSSGITSDMIINLTGFSEKVCQQCMEELKENKDIWADNRELDVHLRNMEIFDLL